jgi:hypothetical protein
MMRTTNIIRLIATTALATTFAWAAARSANGAPIAPPATQPWLMITSPTPSDSEAQPVSVPEPQTIGALALAACAFLARRRRNPST